jgi:hypothetical protein
MLPTTARTSSAFRRWVASAIARRRSGRANRVRRRVQSWRAESFEERSPTRAVRRSWERRIAVL